MEYNVDDFKHCMCVPLNETEEVMNSTDWNTMSPETCHLVSPINGGKYAQLHLHIFMQVHCW